MTSGPKRISAEDAAARASQQRELLEGRDTEILRQAHEMLTQLGRALAVGGDAAVHYVTRMQEIKGRAVAPPHVVRATDLALRLLFSEGAAPSAVREEDLVVALTEVERELRLPHRVAAAIDLTLSRDLVCPRLADFVIEVTGEERGVRDDQPLAADAPLVMEISAWLDDPPAHARGPGFADRLGRWREAWNKLLRLVADNAQPYLFPSDDAQRAAAFRGIGQRLEALWQARAGEQDPSAIPGSVEALRGTEEIVLDLIADMVDVCYTGWKERLELLERMTPTVEATASCGSAILEGEHVAQEFRRSVVKYQSCPLLVRAAFEEEAFGQNVHAQEEAAIACNALFALGLPDQEVEAPIYLEGFSEVLEDPGLYEQIFWEPAQRALPRLVELMQVRFGRMTPEQQAQVFEGLLDLYQEEVRDDPSIRVESGQEAQALAALRQEFSERNLQSFDPKDPERRSRDVAPLLRTLQRRFGLPTGIQGSAALAAEDALQRIHPDVSSRLLALKARAQRAGQPMPCAVLAERLRTDPVVQHLLTAEDEDPHLRHRLEEGIRRLADVETPEGRRAYDQHLQEEVHGLLREWPSLEARYQGLILQQLLRHADGLTGFGARVWMALLGEGQLQGAEALLRGFLEWCGQQRSRVMERSLGEPWGRLFSPDIERAFWEHPELLGALERDGISVEAVRRLQPEDLTGGGELAVPLEEYSGYHALEGEVLRQTVAELVFQLACEGALSLDDLVLRRDFLRRCLSWAVGPGRVVLYAMGGALDIAQLLQLSEADLDALQRVATGRHTRAIFERLAAARTAEVGTMRFEMESVLQDCITMPARDIALAAERVAVDRLFELFACEKLSLSQLAALTPDDIARYERLDPRLFDLVRDRRMDLPEALRIQERGADRYFQVCALRFLYGISDLDRVRLITESLERLPDDAFTIVHRRLQRSGIERLFIGKDPHHTITILAGLSDADFALLLEQIRNPQENGLIVGLFTLPDLRPDQLSLILRERFPDFIDRIASLPPSITSPLLSAMLWNARVSLEVLLLPEGSWHALEELTQSFLWQFIERGWLSVYRALQLQKDEVKMVAGLTANQNLQAIIMECGAVRQGGEPWPVPAIQQFYAGFMRRILSLALPEQERLLALLQDQDLVEMWRRTGTSPEPYLAMDPEALKVVVRLWRTLPSHDLLLQHAGLRALLPLSTSDELTRLFDRIDAPAFRMVYVAAQRGLIDAELLATLSEAAFHLLVNRIDHPTIQALTGELMLTRRRRDPVLNGLVELSPGEFDRLVQVLQRPEELEALAVSDLSLEDFVRERG